MKKTLSLLLALILIFSISTNAFAALEEPNKENGKGNEKSTVQKEFKFELNERKNELTKQNGTLEEQKEQLGIQYQELSASGDSAGAQAILDSIADLDAQISVLKTEMKQIINERYMVIKTMYSEDELAQFDSAAALIEQMYADAETLEAGSVTVKNNLIKFEAPPYIKAGKTLVPIRAITEALGADVVWDEATRSVTVSKDNIVVVITINSTTVLVDGFR